VLAEQIRRAQLRGWHLAARALSRDLEYSIQSLQRELNELQQRANPVQRTPATSAGELYKDLMALQEEFEELDFDVGTHRLSVITETILLDGVYLGPFEIQLNWSRALDAERPAYLVIAKDPHPAESRDNVTHPHVMDELLCEGDGKHAIRLALSEGRLLDFFTLVANVLRTYNPESPFVELALWRGSTCSDCGVMVAEDYSYTCHRCGENVCGECESLCGGCEESFCSGCIGGCAACEDSFCRHCLNTCQGCHRRVCSGCLDEQERCTKCYEEELENDAHEPATTSPEI
jgi:hypothetical protein